MIAVTVDGEQVVVDGVRMTPEEADIEAARIVREAEEAAHAARRDADAIRVATGQARLTARVRTWRNRAEIHGWPVVDNVAWELIPGTMPKPHPRPDIGNRWSGAPPVGTPIRAHRGRVAHYTGDNGRCPCGAGPSWGVVAEPHLTKCKGWPS